MPGDQPDDPAKRVLEEAEEIRAVAVARAQIEEDQAAIERDMAMYLPRAFVYTDASDRFPDNDFEFPDTANMYWDVFKGAFYSLVTCRRCGITGHCWVAEGGLPEPFTCPRCLADFNGQQHPIPRGMTGWLRRQWKRWTTH